MTLIAISNNNVGGTTTQTVNARELHGFLESKQEFSNWIKNRINQYGFIDGHDFTIDKVVIGKATQFEYHLTLGMGKELAMVERTAKGKQARQYFIECERQAKQAHTGQQSEVSPELQIAQAILLAGKMIEEQKVLIAEMQPKADFYDAVTGSDTAIDMAIVAKTLDIGIGRNQLFQFLRDRAILDRHNIPYQEYCNRGYFRVIESQYNKPDGSSHISFKTVVFQKGLDYIRRKLDEDSDKRLAA